MAVRVPLSETPLQAPPSDVLITPRVLNQAAFDDLAASLHSLIAQADGSARELRGVLGDLAGSRNAATKSSGFLQERLKVSAHMVKAFQTQIEHVEALLEGLGRQRLDAERALEEIEERIEFARDRADALTSLVESAEVNIAVTAHRGAQLASQTATRSEETRETP